MSDLQSQWRQLNWGPRNNQTIRDSPVTDHENHRDTTHKVDHHAHSHEDLEDTEGPEDIVIFHNENETVHRNEDNVARELAQKVKILCWIMTQPDNHKSKVKILKLKSIIIKRAYYCLGTPCKSNMGKKM